MDISEKDLKQKIYEQYLAAFRKGVYNLIKEDYDLSSKETLPRKYFSGGLTFKLGKQQIGRADAGAAKAITQDIKQKIDSGRFASSSVRMTEGGEAATVTKLVAPIKTSLVTA